jgi:hypothetical protein
MMVATLEEQYIHLPLHIQTITLVCVKKDILIANLPDL